MLSPTVWKILKVFGHLPRNLLEPHQPSAPEPLDLICFLPRNPPEPWLICTGALPNPPELHQLSAPEPSGTSSAICTGTLRNFISHLHRTLRNLLRNLVLQLHRIAPELFWAKDPIASFAVGEVLDLLKATGKKKHAKMMVYIVGKMDNHLEQIQVVVSRVGRMMTNASSLKSHRPTIVKPVKHRRVPFLSNTNDQDSLYIIKWFRCWGTLPLCE